MKQHFDQHALTEIQPQEIPGDRFSPTPETVAVLAFEYWEQRGNPIGSADEDWFRAERELRHRTAPGSVL